MKKLNFVFNRNVFNFLRSPEQAEQYKDEINTEKQTRDLIDYEGNYVGFDDVLDFTQKALDPFSNECASQSFRCYLTVSILFGSTIENNTKQQKQKKFLYPHFKKCTIFLQRYSRL